jgi:rod shape-determining protein MreC
MAKRSKVSIVFVVLLAISILLFFASRSGFLAGPQGLVAKVFSPFQSMVFSLSNGIISSNEGKTEALEEENKALAEKLVSQDRLNSENKALRDQFDTQFPKSNTLLPAKIVGAPNFIPGVTDPSIYIVDKGLNDKIKVGSAVVYKNILVGKIISASDYFSKVGILTSQNFTVTVKDQRSAAIGVVKGDGGRRLSLDNVVQSQEIKTSDIMVTKGDQSEDGTGTPPDLIIGKILSVDKKPSAIFQRGVVESPLDFSDLTDVFIVVN